MFFPILLNLKKFQVNEVLIRELDAWLGTRREAILKHLDPFSFSIVGGISADYATSIFALCCNTDIGVLSPKIILECPRCERMIDVTKLNKKTVTCNECENVIKISQWEENITVWFELTAEPDITFISEIKGYFKEAVASPQSSGLAWNNLKNSGDEHITDLFREWAQRTM